MISSLSLVSVLGSELHGSSTCVSLLDELVAIMVKEKT